MSIELQSALNEARWRRIEAHPEDQAEILASYEKLFDTSLGEAEYLMSAREIELACGIPEHETMLWNHDGVVPASHVIREAFTGRAWLSQLLGGQHEVTK